MIAYVRCGSAGDVVRLNEQHAFDRDGYPNIEYVIVHNVSHELGEQIASILKGDLRCQSNTTGIISVQEHLKLSRC